jgi:glycosyltransferase involved in cell wall biosynthesis
VKIINKRNEGVSSARNFGIDVANGEFIGFVDSDDFIDKNMYNRIYSCVDDNTDLVVLVTHTINTTELLVKDINSISGYEALGYIFKLEFPTSLWACLYRRDIVGNIRLNEEVHFFEDFEFNTKILMNSKQVALCRDRLYQYEINETSINSQKINEKKISCLEIYDSLLQEPYICDDPILKSKAAYFRAHFMVSIILSLSDSLDIAEKKHFVLVKENALKTLKDSLKSRHVPTKHKIVIFFTALSPSIATKGIHLLKSIRKRKTFSI